VIQTTLKNKQCAVSPDGSLEGHLAWLRGMHGAVLKSKAWLWQYGAEGMEKEDYTEAMANIEAIVQSSQSLWADPAPLTLPPSQGDYRGELVRHNGELVVVGCGARVQGSGAVGNPTGLALEKAGAAVAKLREREGAACRATFLPGGLPSLLEHNEQHPHGGHRVVFLLVDAADPEAAQDLESASREHGIVVSDMVVAVVILPEDNASSEQWAAAALYMAWDAQKSHLTVLLQGSQERAGRVVHELLASSHSVQEAAMHLTPHRSMHIVVAYQEEGAGTALEPNACMLDGRDGDDEASIGALLSLFSGCNARGRLEAHLATGLPPSKHPKLYDKRGELALAVDGAADEPEGAFLYSSVVLASCPRKVLVVLVAMIAAAEEVSQDGDKLEDAAEELEGVKRSYEAILSLGGAGGVSSPKSGGPFRARGGGGGNEDDDSDDSD